MHGAIDRLKADIDRSSALVSRLKNAGMEMGAQELALSTARSQLTLARTEVHAFDATRVEPIANDGLKIVSDVNTAGDKAVAELRFRRRGLAASLGAILLVVIALGLKIQQIERGDRT